MTNILPPHGGYRNLISYQTTTIIYDFTVEFVKKYIDPKSRTRDQTCLPAGRWNKQLDRENKTSLKGVRCLVLPKKWN